MSETLSLLFPELSIAPAKGDLTPILNKFERMAGDADGPIRAIRRTPARPAEYADFPEDLNPKLREVMARRGIERLYTHQAEACERITAGSNAVIVTPTASGKTLCYNLPVLNRLTAEPGARAMYLFPTKALAEDQLDELHGLIEAMGSDLCAFTYDGDTPQDARRAIRQRANIVLTNPDMLHTGILPHHTKWAKLFESLRYIVVDELHYYRGVYGSHLANIMRRLRRLCEFYGSKPQFIACSATIANPKELAETLIESPFELIDRNGAPAGEKIFICYNPPVVNRQLGIRRSYINETRRIALELLDCNQQTLVFANNRLATEILVTYLKDACDKGRLPTESVRGYRGGYLPRERREIEKRLRSGDIRAVVATNALELGIDVGSLDAVVMAGYPGAIASTWQRAGRAGRRNTGSLAIMVASSAPVDQYVVEHPEYLFERSPEHAYVNPDNLEILLNHLKCGAFELPIRNIERFGPHEVPELCAFLSDAGLLHLSGDCWHWTSDSYPADAVSLRSVSSDNFVVVDITGESKIIGEVSYTAADHAARKSHLPARSETIPRRAVRLQRAQGLREARGQRLLHGCHRLHAGESAAGVREGRYFRRRRACTWRCTGESPDRRLQENQVLYERERGRGQAFDAGAADAYDGVLAALPRPVSRRVRTIHACRTAKRAYRTGQRVPHDCLIAVDVRPAGSGSGADGRHLRWIAHLGAGPLPV